jgi:glycosyltransferase involved in cell wall biosynthesis
VRISRGRALLILPESPYPPRWGNALRDAQQITLLQRLGYDVALLCVRPRIGSSASADTSAVHAGIGIEFVAEDIRDLRESLLGRIRRKIRYLRSRNAAHPFACWCIPYLLPAAFPERVAALAPDVVVVRSLFLDLLPGLRRRFHRTIVVDCHDADVHLAREMIRSVPWWRAAGPWANYRGVRTVYRSFLSLADEIWAVSREDAERIRPFAASRPVLVVPSGVDEWHVVPAADAGCDDVCALVANFGYGPNLNAAHWLVERVWPRVRKQRPAARLLLVGGGAEDEVCNLATSQPGVTATGVLKDLSPIYAEAGVMLAPLHQGGGSRLKIVEAWKHGKAVLATSKGLEGTGPPIGVAAVRDRPQDFAEALAALMENGEERRLLGEAGRQFAARHLSFAHVEQVMRSHSILSRRSPAAALPSGRHA